MTPFMTFYVAAAGLAVGFGALSRLLIGWRAARAGAGASDRPAASDVGYLAGGDNLAVRSALSGLVSAQTVAAGADGKAVVTGILPAGASELDRAVHAAVANGIRPAALYRDAGVQRALIATRDRLVAAGLLYSEAQQRLLRWSTYLLFAVAGIGLVSVAGHLMVLRAATGLLITTGVVVAVTALLRNVPITTGRGNALIGQPRMQFRRRPPGTVPGGAAMAGLGVAGWADPAGDGTGWGTTVGAEFLYREDPRTTPDAIPF